MTLPSVYRTMIREMEALTKNSGLRREVRPTTSPRREVGLTPGPRREVGPSFLQDENNG